jgi:hypothetical protein
MEKKEMKKYSLWIVPYSDFNVDGMFGIGLRTPFSPPIFFGKIPTFTTRQGMKLTMKTFPLLPLTKKEVIISQKQFELAFQCALQHRYAGDRKDNLNKLNDMDSCLEFVQQVYHAAQLPLYFTCLFTDDELSKLGMTISTHAATLYGSQDTVKDLFPSTHTKVEIAKMLWIPVNSIQMVSTNLYQFDVKENFIPKDYFNLQVEISRILWRCQFQIIQKLCALWREVRSRILLKKKETDEKNIMRYLEITKEVYQIPADIFQTIRNDEELKAHLCHLKVQVAMKMELEVKRSLEENLIFQQGLITKANHLHDLCQKLETILIQRLQSHLIQKKSMEDQEIVRNCQKIEVLFIKKMNQLNL